MASIKKSWDLADSLASGIGEMGRNVKAQRLMDNGADANYWRNGDIVAAVGQVSDTAPMLRRGIVTTDFGGFDVGFSMVLQANGKILVAGYSNIAYSDNDIALVHQTEYLQD